MKQESSKSLAEKLHGHNVSQIKRLVAKMEDPETPAIEKAQIKETLTKILAHVEKRQLETESIFVRFFRGNRGNGKKSD